ncbi:MAG TPA: GAF domain-containing sensor histidine kinase [Anaerolineales bacterium]|nr:GAF domain-containing sensor histidine kinase [Anaerolineales bacterium]
MTRRQLKWVSVVLPLLFVVAVLYVRLNLVPAEYALEGNLYAILAVSLGAVVFSIVFFGIIERREEEIHQSNLHLEALHQAALALTNQLDLQVVLQNVVDLSRELLNAKYGALGVVELETNRIKQFTTSGITDAQRALIGAPPQGHGLLGVLNPGGKTLIVDDIRKDPRSVGFPPNHPPMKSLLGVPIKSKGEIFGNLYVADKVEITPGGEERLVNFHQADCLLLEKFATQAAIAIENAQLYRKTQELAVLQERERFGMALHDGIMQQVYATGLSLQEALSNYEDQPEESQQRMSQAIGDLSEVLRDLRNYILGLRTGRYHGQDLASSLAQMARELHANTLMNVQFAPPPKVAMLNLTEEQTDELVYIVQEALNNIRKHAYARNVDLALKREGDRVRLIIDDDGVGFDLQDTADAGGNGLRNMRERALTLDAEIKVWSQKGKGTHINLSVPVSSAREAVPQA